MVDQLNLLIDTHVLVWFLDGNSKLSDQTKNLISLPENTIFVSSISLWEIEIKVQLGKLKSPKDLDVVLREQGFTLLDFSAAHALATNRLPLHHRDPFDRALISQSLVENLELLTADEVLTLYRDTIKVLIA